LYRKAITINYDSLKGQFDILGVIINEGVYLEVFQPSIDYEAFLVLKKDYI